MPLPSKSKAPSRLVQPRANPSDAFEQNPLATSGESSSAEAKSARSALGQGEQRVQEAVRRVIEDGAVAGAVAREFGLAPSSIYLWKKRYFDYVSRQVVEAPAGSGAAVSNGILSAQSKQRFADNWSRLIDATHATSRDFEQEPLVVFLQTSPYTGWLYDDDGRFQRGLLAGLLILIIGGAAILLGLTVDRGPGNRNDAEAAARKSDSPAEMPKPRHDLEVAKAAETVQAFLRAEGWPLRVRFIHNGSKKVDALKDFFTRNSDAPVTDAVLSLGMVGDGIVSLAFEVPSQKRTLFFNVIPEGREYLMDWETSTLVQEERIERLLREKLTTPTRIFVLVSRDDYYNRQWSDEKKFQCFKLQFPGLERNIFGYTARDSKVGIDLLALTASPDNYLHAASALEPSPENEELKLSHAAVVDVRFPDNAQDPRQVEITQLHRADWFAREDIKIPPTGPGLHSAGDR
jgi:hypothetical protein